jgi:hypothetical protein
MNTIHTLSGKLVEIKWERTFEVVHENDVHNWVEVGEGKGDDGKPYQCHLEIVDDEMLRFIEFV